MKTPSPSRARLESDDFASVLAGWQDTSDHNNELDGNRGANIRGLGTNTYRSGTAWDGLIDSLENGLDGKHDLSERDFTSREWENLLSPLRKETRDRMNALRMSMLSWEITDEDHDPEDEISD